MTSALSCVLIVDDNALVRRALRRALSHLSKVDEAGDAQTALLRLNATAYDVVLCDADLRGTSGQWILQRAREVNPSGVRVLCSASDRSCFDHLLRSGVAQAFLAKPIDVHDLRTLVEFELISRP